MINRPTVLVLGAGASYDYGFPLGRVLLFNVLQFCRRSDAKGICTAAGVDPSGIAELGEIGPVTQAPSIDTLLEYRPEFIQVGKVAIAYEMIPCEKPDQLQMQRDNLRWYEYLFKRMLDQAKTPDDFEKNQLSVVTFNYDRSLEFCLFGALKNMYGIAEAKAAEV